MHLAAAEYFRSENIPFSNKVTIGGYSMGGMGVVSLHRHIEQYDTAGLIVESSYPGGGVYDLGMAIDYWYGLDLDYTQVFVDPLLSNMDD